MWVSPFLACALGAPTVAAAINTAAPAATHRVAAIDRTVVSLRRPHLMQAAYVARQGPRQPSVGWAEGDVVRTGR
ncbi:hypothetical protein MMON_36670 [Mycolicibacterium monacense]|uniref:Uncharacterized protein n=1 Tax=Mycolicibacterium monacense TaxID=85693 RepID=A0AAD1IWS4_MYCMB|nr:hypothetical protein MMON_36670 [Mycolicibacterium monacense]